ncbi:quinone oxidoreductase family protein [Marisediminicola senii]|uniref:quinone oxidoreductase family protein n=1 Tax=Marisediminicola senii TaxID=2711233 RepID=UPI0013EBA082|nr:NADP-dependent oxidoreductase [Marisediminicola senii]
MARIVQYTEFGGPEVLHLVDVPDPQPAAGEVVVAVEAAGLNPLDWKVRARIRETGEITTPRRPGFDGAGVIAAVGSDVTGWSVGDEVVIAGATGTYATLLAVDTAHIDPKPASLSFAQGAAIGVPIGTAYQVLRSLGVRAGDVLLIHGGSGAVGQAAIQFATAWGATVIATARRENHQRIAELDAIPVSYGPGLLERIRDVAPGGVDVVLDGAGTDEALDASFALVADRNRIGTIVVGARAAELGIRAWSGGNPVPLTEEEQRDRKDAVRVVGDLVGRGRFEIEIGAEYPLDEAVEAHRRSQAGGIRGKIVLIP